MLALTPAHVRTLAHALPMVKIHSWEHVVVAGAFMSDSQVSKVVQRSEQREQVPRPERNSVPGGDLLEMGLEFASLQLRLRAQLETQEKAWPGSSWTPELEEEWSRLIDPIRDRMVTIRWLVTTRPAHSIAELRTKATILMDLVDDDPQDASAQLTLSLCRDLIGLPD